MLAHMAVGGASLKDAANWTDKQLAQLHWLQRSGLKAARAWRLKERLREVFVASSNAVRADALLTRWIS